MGDRGREVERWRKSGGKEVDFIQELYIISDVSNNNERF